MRFGLKKDFLTIRQEKVANLSGKSDFFEKKAVFPLKGIVVRASPAVIITKFYLQYTTLKQKVKRKNRSYFYYTITFAGSAGSSVRHTYGFRGREYFKLKTCKLPEINSEKHYKLSSETVEEAKKTSASLPFQFFMEI